MKAVRAALQDYAISQGLGGEVEVGVSPEGIVIEERGAWRARSTRLPAGEILGLDYGTSEDAFASAQWGAKQRVSAGRGVPPRWLAVMRRLVASKGITVKSRKGLFTFGAGLPDDEIRYLHALVVRALGDPDGRRW